MCYEELTRWPLKPIAQKEAAHLPKSVRFGVPEHDDILEIEEYDKVIPIPTKCYEPFRTIDTGGQLKALLSTVRRRRVYERKVMTATNESAQLPGRQCKRCTAQI